MKCKKIFYIPEEHKEALEDIKEKVKKNGGYVSCNRLMQDGITIFLEKYKDQAIMKYSPMYE